MRNIFFPHYLSGEPKNAGQIVRHSVLMWALTDSNRRPSACKADALNQLS